MHQGFFSILFRIYPISRNKIVVNNHNGQGYGDNAKYIVNELLKSDNDYDIVWFVKNDIEKDFPKNIRTVKVGSLRSIYERTTAKVWLENNRVNQFLFKRKRQFYIQLWHGGLGLKKIAADAPNGLSKRTMRFAKRDARMADLYVSNSQHLSDIYRRAFWYEGEILECGYPKNDILFSDKRCFKEKIRSCYHLPSNSKIALYAPTFRDGNSTSAYDIDIDLLRSSLEKYTSREWVIMVRLHPNTDPNTVTHLLKNNIIDASSYPDMQEVVLSVDMLITDYSSCMFDSAQAEIATFIYASDAKDYIDERGFYFSLEELPFSVARDTKELVSNILAFNSEIYERELKYFYRRVGLFDKGEASQHVSGVVEQYVDY